MSDDRANLGVVAGQAVLPRSGNSAPTSDVIPAPHAQFAAGRRDPVTVELSAREVDKRYVKAQNVIPVLRRVNLDIVHGEFLSIVGQSGCGKSTLIHLLGTLDRPDGGQIMSGDRRIDNLPARQRDALRNRYFGMIFQFYHLLPELTALGNVLAPLMIGKSTLGYLRQRHELRRRAKNLLELVGLGHRLNHKPCELSGGEMQRTAIARALINQPSVLLADEPTGNLDHKTGREILHILRSLNEQQNLTIVMVTHDDEIARQADRTVRLVKGQIQQV